MTLWHHWLLDVMVLTDRFWLSVLFLCVFVCIFVAESAEYSFMAFQRRKMSKRKSRQDFSRKSGANKRNYRSAPMRGGIRL